MEGVAVIPRTALRNGSQVLIVDDNDRLQLPGRRGVAHQRRPGGDRFGPAGRRARLPFHPVRRHQRHACAGLRGASGTERIAGRHEGGRMNPLAWFAKHAVAANLLMVLIIAGGAIAIGGLPFGPEELRGGSIRQEVFPEFNLDFIIDQRCLSRSRAVGSRRRRLRPYRRGDPGPGRRQGSHLRRLGEPRRGHGRTASGCDLVRGARRHQGSGRRDRHLSPGDREAGHHRDARPPRGDRRRRLGRCRREDATHAGRTGQGRPGRTPGDHGRADRQRTPLRGLHRGLGGSASPLPVDVRRGCDRRASLEPGPSRRVGQDGRRRDPVANEGAGLLRSGISRSWSC